MRGDDAGALPEQGADVLGNRLAVDAGGRDWQHVAGVVLGPRREDQPRLAQGVRVVGDDRRAVADRYQLSAVYAARLDGGDQLLHRRLEIADGIRAVRQGGIAGDAAE